MSKEITKLEPVNVPAKPAKKHKAVHRYLFKNPEVTKEEIAHYAERNRQSDLRRVAHQVEVARLTAERDRLRAQSATDRLEAMAVDPDTGKDK